MAALALSGSAGVIVHHTDAMLGQLLQALECCLGCARASRGLGRVTPSLHRFGLQAAVGLSCRSKNLRVRLYDPKALANHQRVVGNSRRVDVLLVSPEDIEVGLSAVLGKLDSSHVLRICPTQGT